MPFATKVQGTRQVQRQFHCVFTCWRRGPHWSRTGLERWLVAETKQSICLIGDACRSASCSYVKPQERKSLGCSIHYAKKKNNPKLTTELATRERSISRAKPRKIVKAPKQELMMRNWSFSLLSAHLIRHHGYTITQIMKALVKKNCSVQFGTITSKLRLGCSYARDQTALSLFFTLLHSPAIYRDPGKSIKTNIYPAGFAGWGKNVKSLPMQKTCKQLKIKVNGIVMEKQIQSNVKSRLFCREPASKFYHRARTCRKIDSTKTLPNISRSCSPKLHKEWPLNQLSAEAFLPLFRYAFLENRKSK